MVLPSISEKPLPFFSEQCQRFFSRSTKAKAIFHCLSNLFSNICFLSENIPSVVPRPFLKPSCSSPKLCSTLSCNLLSRILSSYFIISLSRVIPLYFPGCCAPPFRFHMGTINLVRQSSGTLHCFMHVFNSLFVHLAPISPATSTISACISSHPGALPFFIPLQSSSHFYP